MAIKTFEYSTFNSNKAKLPSKVEHLTIEELQAKFSKMKHLVMEKDKAPLYLLSKLDGKGRKKENILSAEAIVLDVDVHHEEQVMEKAMEILKPFAFIIHTTYSHKAADSRYRIIVPLLHHVDAENFQKEHYGSRLAAMLKLKVDACSDLPTQCYYLPTRPKIAAASDHFIVVNDSTDLLDAKNLPLQAAKTATKGSKKSNVLDELLDDESNRLVPANLMLIFSIMPDDKC